jgi:hypothetical protein
MKHLTIARVLASLALTSGAIILSPSLAYAANTYHLDCADFSDPTGFNTSSCTAGVITMNSGSGTRLARFTPTFTLQDNTTYYLYFTTVPSVDGDLSAETGGNVPFQAATPVPAGSYAWVGSTVDASGGSFTFRSTGGNFRGDIQYVCVSDSPTDCLPPPPPSLFALPLASSTLGGVAAYADPYVSALILLALLLVGIPIGALVVSAIVGAITKGTTTVIGTRGRYRGGSFARTGRNRRGGLNMLDKSGYDT